MLNKLLLCLVLVAALVFGPIGGGIYAMETEQTCTVLEQQKIIQVMPDKSLRGIVTPSEHTIALGPKLTEKVVTRLNKTAMPFDWTGGHMAIIEIDFGNGMMPLLIIVRPENVKDCK